jgi:AraC-like DNA-binding protein
MEKEQARIDRIPSIVQSYLQILLSQVQRYNDNKLSTPISRKFMNQFKLFKRNLEIHFRDNQGAAFYASQLNITQHHLNLICKEVASCTTTDIIKARSVLEAKRLLSFTDKTIAEIALDLNFTDSSHLTKMFRSLTHQTPQQFKSKMSENYLIK